MDAILKPWRCSTFGAAVTPLTVYGHRSTTSSAFVVQGLRGLCQKRLSILKDHEASVFLTTSVISTTRFEGFKAFERAHGAWV